jgi:ATP phosphoribosyltransferase regulatory subunit
VTTKPRDEDPGDGASVRLPAGVRDYLPRAARRRRVLAETLVAEFERWGYRRVITPAFEYEEVLERGAGASARGAIRFVEPLSGEVAVLRPDITPQVARLVATRLREQSGPLRLCYEGSVLRLQTGPRGQREIIQAGIELYDLPGAVGDVEVVALAAAALEASQLCDFTLELGHPGFARGAVQALGLPPAASAAVLQAVGKKDQATVDALVQGARRASPAARRLARALPGLYGGIEVLPRARRLAPPRPLAAALDAVAAVVFGLRRRGVTERLAVDLGEVRGMGYYTGLRFAAYVAGQGEAILAGGRYDDLCGRYGRPRTATGFAVDVEAAALAQKARGTPPPPPEPGVLVCGPAALAWEVCAALRRAGRRAAAHPPAPPARLRAHAERWDFTSIVDLRRASATELAALKGGELPEEATWRA